MLAQLIDVPMFPAQRLLMLWGIQIRMARAALRWSAQELANRARLGIATVQRAERLGIDVPAITAANLFAIQRAFEGAGITFIDDGEQSLSGGPGLRLSRVRPGAPVAVMVTMMGKNRICLTIHCFI